MKELVCRLAKQMPEAGLAIHGTPFKNVEGIRKHGLMEVNGKRAYVCPFPGMALRYWEARGHSIKEAFERSVGSVLFALPHACSRLSTKPDIDEGDLPAIVAFRGREGILKTFSMGYDEEVRRNRYFHPRTRWKAYRSFGKEAVYPIPPEFFAWAVNMTRDEHRALLEKSKGSFDFNDKAEKLMIFKTLTALRETIERG